MAQPENRYESRSLGELILGHGGYRREGRHRDTARRCAREGYLWERNHSKTPSLAHEREEYFASYRKSTIQTPEARFETLLEEWREETGGLSIARQIQSHPTYLKLIGMGERALPYLLAQVQQGRRFLFVALESIADEYPASETKTFEEARDAWIKWGQDRNLI